MSEHCFHVRCEPFNFQLLTICLDTDFAIRSPHFLQNQWLEFDIRLEDFLLPSALSEGFKHLAKILIVHFVWRFLDRLCLQTYEPAVL